MYFKYSPEQIIRGGAADLQSDIVTARSWMASGTVHVGLILIYLILLARLKGTVCFSFGPVTLKGGFLIFG